MYHSVSSGVALFTQAAELIAIIVISKEKLLTTYSKYHFVFQQHVIEYTLHV